MADLVASRIPRPIQPRRLPDTALLPSPLTKIPSQPGFAQGYKTQKVTISFTRHLHRQ